MTLQEWCKFIKAIKEKAGYTNTEVAEGADVSLSTVESIMSLNRDKDIMRDTARRIENFVLGVGTGYPCYLAFEENIRETIHDPAAICAILEKAGFRQVRCADRLLADSNPSTTWFITATK
jgi:transcriptional regulator with XRE-family HTH domain